MLVREGRQMRGFRRGMTVMAISAASLLGPSRVRCAEITAPQVLRSIERGRQFLISRQRADGSWGTAVGGRYHVGISALSALALLNSGMTVKDEPIRRALKYLRSLRDPDPKQTYEVALTIMVFVAAKDGLRDRARIQRLAAKLESWQVTTGANSGLWSYGPPAAIVPGGNPGGDPSNGQFAILGLRDAAHVGIAIRRSTWERAARHWRTAQNPDGGWSYTRSGPIGRSSGSMTVAGIATLVITSSMLRDDKDLNPDGTPVCCRPYKPDKELERGRKWLLQHFAVGYNPGRASWLLYYLYGLERAGRLSGQRLYGKHDWYREGAEFLVKGQSPQFGSWAGVGGLESTPVVGTSLVLLFLSKGLAPVIINKLKYGPPHPLEPNRIADDNWNRHRDDIRNMTELISGLPKWPKLVTWQVVDLPKAVRLRREGVRELLQAPILYLSGRDSYDFPPEQVKLLREYLDQGGFLFAVRNCQGIDFERGLRKLVAQMYPAGTVALKPLTADHPVYRSEYLLDPKTVRLMGVDLNCRTPIIYSPDDLSCLWDKWSRQDPPRRTPDTKAMITRATRIGLNVIAYATGREPPSSLARHTDLKNAGKQDVIKRGLLQVAELRHSGQWDIAPHALRNLLMALNRTVGMSASTRQRNLAATDSNIFKYPIVFMHGRKAFTMSRQEIRNLREYLRRGGLLFADAACGDRKFDRSFRRMIAQLYPDKKLKRIPPDHELFTSKVGFDVRSVRRREPEVANPKVAINTVVRTGKPFLEGVEVENHFSVIYSKYDLSCVLERQSSVACVGYVPEDALKIAINVILYAMLQDVDYRDFVK